MTDRATLLALAARCEQAAGPDAGLDLAMWTTFLDTPGFQPLSPWRTDYTASLDAAVTLVPEGWIYELGRGESGTSRALCRMSDERGIWTGWAVAATAALALCATALRAMAATNE
jgi:hypothetical protein